MRHGLIKGIKDKGREILISRGEEKTTCEQVQSDRKSHRDTKQSQITLVPHGTLVQTQ